MMAVQRIKHLNVKNKSIEINRTCKESWHSGNLLPASRGVKRRNVAKRTLNCQKQPTLSKESLAQTASVLFFLVKGSTFSEL